MNANDLPFEVALLERMATDNITTANGFIKAGLRANACAHLRLAATQFEQAEAAQLRAGPAAFVTEQGTATVRDVIEIEGKPVAKAS